MDLKKKKSLMTCQSLPGFGVKTEAQRERDQQKGEKLFIFVFFVTNPMNIITSVDGRNEAGSPRLLPFCLL